MSLRRALKSIVEWKNVSILYDSSLIKLLNDYDAFAEYPSSENVLSTMIKQGILVNIVNDYSNKEEPNAKQYVSELNEKYGFGKEVASYVIHSIFSSLGYNAPESLSSIEENVPIKHLTFRDIEIEGPASIMCEKLKKLGYRSEKKTEFGYVLEGDFAGISNCDILIIESEYIGEVRRILVSTPIYDRWYSLKEEYFKFKQMYIRKYGDDYNVKSYEFFSSPYEEGDGDEMTALYHDKCTYCTYIKLAEGTIRIGIMSNGRICFGYEDCINTEEHNIVKNNSAYEQI